MSSVDVAAIRAAMAKATPGPWLQYDEDQAFGRDGGNGTVTDDDGVGECYYSPDAELIVLLRNNAEALLDALERAQAASAGVDMLVAQAERRGAVKALRIIGQKWEDGQVRHPSPQWVQAWADAMEIGADL